MTPQEKFNVIARVYFSASHKDGDNTNPEPITPDGFAAFLQLQVNDMMWGSAPSVREHSMQRLVGRMTTFLSTMGITFPPGKAFQKLTEAESGKKSNTDLIRDWATLI